MFHNLFYDTAVCYLHDMTVIMAFVEILNCYEKIYLRGISFLPFFDHSLQRPQSVHVKRVVFLNGTSCD